MLKEHVKNNANECAVLPSFQKKRRYSNQNARLVNILFLVLVQKMLVHREIWNKTFQPNAFYIEHQLKKSTTRDFVQCFYEEVGHTSWFEMYKKHVILKHRANIR